MADEAGFAVPDGSPSDRSVVSQCLSVSHSGRCYHRVFKLLRYFAMIIAVPSMLAANAAAQKQFTPDNQEVERLVQQGVDFLKKQPTDNFGFNVLAALAIVEASKRYAAEIPADDPVVKAAINKIMAHLPANDGGKGVNENHLLRMNEMYIPSLSTILLAEVNSAKYKEPIQRLLKMFEERQQANGGFTYAHETNVGDMSQTQFVSLAMYVAKQHGFAVAPQRAAATLQFTITTQRPGGYWIYKVSSPAPNNPGQAVSEDKPYPSMHAAGLGTAYLLADLLQLTARKKDMEKAVASEELAGLPKTVTVYVKPVEGEAAGANKEGPLVNFNMGQFAASTSAGNAFFEKNFVVFSDNWAFYYLYALERYAWFREQAEGDLGNGRLSNWYDQGVKLLKSRLQKNGSFKSSADAREQPVVATAFAVLFLVRSSEVISLPSSESVLGGDIGFPDDELNVVDGQLVASDSEKNLSDMMSMLGSETSPEQLQALTKSLKKAVGEFKNKDAKSRGDIRSFLRTMISANSFFRRKIAVRFLAGEQDMDNVPALIYALGDPDFRVCIEAQDGLRLISRRIDSLTVSDQTRKNAFRDPDVLNEAEKNAMRMDFNSLKEKWTEWFLKIRPDAELLD